MRQCLEKGQPEMARIYAENAVRKRSEAVNYLRMSAKVGRGRNSKPSLHHITIFLWPLKHVRFVHICFLRSIPIEIMEIHPVLPHLLYNPINEVY